MSIFHSLLLGVVQGLTEFIPVSSTAHLLIASSLLGLPADERVFAFNVIVQLGTLAALILFFWRDYWQIATAMINGIKTQKYVDDFQARLGWLIVVATLPAALAGVALKGWVESMAGAPLLWAGIRLLFTAALLTAVEYFDKKNRPLESATWLDALVVGAFQILAIFPGASRSGSTMAGAMVRGLDRPSAARFAFLMSAPILLAAGLYETVKVFQLPDAASFLPLLLTGFLSAAVVGWFAIRWLLNYLRKHPLYVFSVYCAIVGTAALILWRVG
ncbi:MAG: undecaprenyl-diphosphatase UppP [Anaerolineales bacterium]|nr:undecaprenyl-diphosphatase UppP [Anaerolineales bacterium]